MFDIRIATADDLDFIVHSWMLSMWASPVIRGMTRDDYFAVIRPRIKMALGDQRCMTVVAYANDDPDVILGWATVFAGHTVVWAYTKKSVRNMGVMQACLSPGNVTGYALSSSHVSAPSRYTYRPHIAWDLWRYGGESNGQ